MNTQYVDAFFERGALRIGSFHQFSQHADEARLDKSEGKAIVSHSNTEGEGQTIFAVVVLGGSSYVFCGSSVFSDHIASQFEADSGFRINDTVAFADAIAHRIPGFRGGCEGPCTYAPARTVHRDMGRVDIDDWRHDAESKNLDMGKMMSAIGGMTGDDPLFLKPAKYSEQCEYRFIWHTHDQDLTGFLDIEVPEARQFCTRFEELDSERHRSPVPEQEQEANKTADSTAFRRESP